MDIELEEVYTLVIPVKPDSVVNSNYRGGTEVGEMSPTYDYFDEYKKVFWVWGLSSSGIKKSVKKDSKFGMMEFIGELHPEILKNLGVSTNINGKMVKISKTGYFYSTKDKSINWKFEATSILTTDDIRKSNLEKYVPPFRTIYLDDWYGAWLLITDLKKLEKPFNGKLTENRFYIFPTFDFEFYSNSKNKLVPFNTNHLMQGNAFVIKRETDNENHLSDFVDIEEDEQCISDDSFEEKKNLRYHKHVERNLKLSKRTKEIHGYTCTACGFNFIEKYGEIGTNYIEAHHLIPFSDLNENSKVSPKNDMTVLCANCHRMIHKLQNVSNIEEFKKIIH